MPLRTGLPGLRKRDTRFVADMVWPISTLLMADMVFCVADVVVADVVCGRYRRFPRCPPSSEPANVSTRPYIRYVCLVYLLLHGYSRQNSQQDISLVSLDAISKGDMKSTVCSDSVHVHCTAPNSLTDVMCYATSGKGLTPVASM